MKQSRKKQHPKTYKVTYTKQHDGKPGTVLVKARSPHRAIMHARNVVFTGSDFRNPVETDEKYTKPRKQGFAGRH